MELTELAKSKINLSLNLSGIKIDSYHDLVTFICFGNFSDKLSLKTSQSFSYKVNSSGKNIYLKDDLVLKVIHKIKDMYSLSTIYQIVINSYLSLFEHMVSLHSCFENFHH